VVSEPDDFRRSALECLRLAADCLQLAHSTENPDLKAHFTEAARIWTSLAEGREDPGREPAESS
jgi:hypothetical protein